MDGCELSKRFSTMDRSSTKSNAATRLPLKKKKKKNVAYLRYRGVTFGYVIWVWIYAEKKKQKLQY